MIKSFHKLLVPKSEADYKLLTEFFSALGLARGEMWEGRRSKGLKLEVPESGIEIGMGQGFPDADLVIEADSADMLYDIAQRRGFKIATEVGDQDWGARMFALEIPGGYGKLAIFSYNSDWRHKQTEGELDSTGLRIGIVVGRFNSFITERLLAGALDALKRTGAKDEDIEIVRVPGAFEIPSACRTMAETGKYDALVTIGCLLRGDTAHYDVIVNEATRGIGQSAQETGVPHGFGVLTCENLEQAIDRAGLKAGNKGFEAALAAVEMATLRRKLGASGKAGR